MSVLRRSTKAAVGPAEQRDDRLNGMRPVARDHDERPSREDRTYGETIFTRPTVPLPRWLGGRKQKPR